MAFYHEQIKKLKKQKSRDIIKTIFKNKNVTLQLVDDSDETVRLVLKWRKKFWNWFDTKFEGSHEETKKWINKQILSNKERILFLIIYDGTKIGHIGLDRYNKKDNSIHITDVLRGERGFAPGLMVHIMKAYNKWIFKNLKISKIQLRVFSDAFRAINCYERCGMITVNSIPHKRIFTKDGWKWVKTKLKSDDEYAERYFNIMEILKKL